MLDSGDALATSFDQRSRQHAADRAYRALDQARIFLSKRTKQVGVSDWMGMTKILGFLIWERAFFQKYKKSLRSWPSLVY